MDWTASLSYPFKKYINHKQQHTKPVCLTSTGVGIGTSHTHTHTHTHPFNGPLSGTTRVSLYKKGKTNLDFTEARDSEWQWNPLRHMQVCTSHHSLRALNCNAICARHIMSHTPLYVTHTALYNKYWKDVQMFGRQPINFG